MDRATGFDKNNSGNPRRGNFDGMPKKKKQQKKKKSTKKLTAAGRLRRARHNEKDDRFFYCDYCDKFVGTSQAVRMQHIKSAKHIECYETYYSMVKLEAPEEVKEIQAELRESALTAFTAVVNPPLLQPAHASSSTVTCEAGSPSSNNGTQLVSMLPPTKLGSNIVIGGVSPTAHVAPIVVAPSIRVGNVPVAQSQVLIAVPQADGPHVPITVGGKRILSPTGTDHKDRHLV